MYFSSVSKYFNKIKMHLKQFIFFFIKQSETFFKNFLYFLKSQEMFYFFFFFFIFNNWIHVWLPILQPMKKNGNSFRLFLSQLIMVCISWTVTLISTAKFSFRLPISIWVPSFVSKLLLSFKFESKAWFPNSYSNLRICFRILIRIRSRKRNIEFK